MLSKSVTHALEASQGMRIEVTCEGFGDARSLRTSWVHVHITAGPWPHDGRMNVQPRCSIF